MTAQRVEQDSSRMQAAETSVSAEPKPLEVAHFRAALAAGDAMGGERRRIHAPDIDATSANETPVPAEQLFDLAPDTEHPLSDDRASVAWEAPTDEASPPRTRAMSATWGAHTWLPPSPAVTSARAVLPKKRVELGTHLARQSAMQPVADLLALVRQRAAGQAVPDLKIVPPEPNPLQLTLHLAMNGDEFVVKARTALGADRRDEVQQALHVLESALAARLSMPARVVLLA